MTELMILLSLDNGKNNMTLVKGIKICPKGENIYTCPIDKLVMHTGFNTMKVAHFDTVDPFHDPLPQTFEYAHGLGYAPAFIVATGVFTGSTVSGFVSQYNSASGYEAPFYTDDTVFYYWTACQYFLFHQGTL